LKEKNIIGMNMQSTCFSTNHHSLLFESGWNKPEYGACKFGYDNEYTWM